MRQLLLAAVAALAIGSIHAQTVNCRTNFQGETVCTGSGGYRSYNRDFGNGSGFGNDSYGNNWNSQTYGNGQTYFYNRRY